MEAIAVPAAPAGPGTGPGTGPGPSGQGQDTEDVSSYVVLRGVLRRRRQFSKLLSFFTMELLDAALAGGGRAEGSPHTGPDSGTGTGTGTGMQLVCDGWTAPREIVAGVAVRATGTWETHAASGARRLLVRPDGLEVESGGGGGANEWENASMHAEWRRRSGATCACADPLCPRAHGDPERWAARREQAAASAAAAAPPAGEGDAAHAETCAAKAQHNHVFASWLVHTFPPAALRRGVVDIAGGRGLVGLELLLQHGYSTVALVEPKELKINSTYRRRLKKWQKKNLAAPADAVVAGLEGGGGGGGELAVALDRGKRPRDISGDAEDSDMGAAAEAAAAAAPVVFPSLYHPLVHFREEFYGLAAASAGLQRALRTACGVLVAMHPDAATGAAVETALALGAPFAVVPCCVFTHLFPRRVTPAGAPVASYEELLDYLQALGGPSVLRATLPFEGRNTVLYRL
jgi:hypothetical protein